jgi:hypothetical protein
VEEMKPPHIADAFRRIFSKGRESPFFVPAKRVEFHVCVAIAKNPCPYLRPVWQLGFDQRQQRFGLRLLSCMQIGGCEIQGDAKSPPDIVDI